MANANASQVTETLIARPSGVPAIAPTTECAILASVFVTLASLAMLAKRSHLPKCTLVTEFAMACHVIATVVG
jgi:hypothetical protein